MTEEKKQNKKKLKGGISSLVIFLLVFAVATAAITVSGINRSGKQQEEPAATVEEPAVDPKTGEIDVYEIDDIDEKLSKDMMPIVVDEDSPFYEVFSGQDRVNILLLGVADMMSDTIMVASYDMENQKVSIISVPRDTYYFRRKTDNEAENKINCIYRVYYNRAKEDQAKAGAEAVAAAVSDILYGMPIHCYAIVEYEDVREIMEVIGGVEMNIPFHMKYDDTTKGKELHIDIPAGDQIIDSSNVVEFLRFRHTNPWFAARGFKSYPGGDVQRTAIQREFVSKVLAECLKRGNLLKVVRFCVDNIDHNITLTTGFKVAKKAMKGLSSDNVTMYPMPGTDITISGLSFWKVDKDGVYSMLEEIYGIKEPEPEVTETETTETGEGAQQAQKAGQ
ncbi:MAG: LCP family protein [Firmicutes bacterium]|nr:LCP family protein [Bacillota bacterium]MBQ6012522.1 LCP family protein [Bacillota bacterium]MBQ6261751.1 LCP family protein [Bacillota bacterium]